jgi:hypothetical protein
MRSRSAGSARSQSRNSNIRSTSSQPAEKTWRLTLSSLPLRIRCSNHPVRGCGACTQALLGRAHRRALWRNRRQRRGCRLRGFAARAGTDVEPTCSTASGLPEGLPDLRCLALEHARPTRVVFDEDDRPRERSQLTNGDRARFCVRRWRLVRHGEVLRPSHPGDKCLAGTFSPSPAQER